MAIHNLSYPASSNASPSFSMSNHNSPPFTMSNHNSPLSVSQHHSPSVSGSQQNSPHSYGNSPAKHGSSVKLTTAPANSPPWPIERHQRRVHGSNGLSIGRRSTRDRGGMDLGFWEIKRWDCPHPTCQRKGHRGFNRRDFLVQHCRNVHNQILDEYPSPWTTFR